MFRFVFSSPCRTFPHRLIKTCHNVPSSFLLSKDYAGSQQVILYPCHGSRGNQLWSYDDNVSHFNAVSSSLILTWFLFSLQMKQIRHVITGRCLEMSSLKDKLLIQECRSSNSFQQWKFSKFDQSKMPVGGFVDEE